MRFVKLRQGLVCCLLLGAPATALAQPGADDYGDHYDVSVAGEPVASVDVFYDQLAPYGVWVDDPVLGRVFTPTSRHFVPYTVGHWQYTDLGFVWVSAEPFEWATAHYGRWAYSRDYGRWVWRPDTEWGASWVEWRESGDDFGWAPLAPEFSGDVGYSQPVESWHYCNASHVLDANVSRYYEPRSRVIEIHRDARPIEHDGGGARVVAGPPAATLRERHVDVRPTKIDAHAVGRWTPSEVQTATKRALDHRAANDANNQRRIQSDAALRKVQAKVTTTAPRPAEVRPPAVQPLPKEARQPKQPPQVKQAPAPAPEPARPAPRPPQVKAEPRTEPGRTPVQQAPQAPRAPRVQQAPQAPQAPRAPAPRPEPVQRAKPEPAPAQRAEPRQPQPRPEPVQKAEPRQPQPQPQPRPQRAEPPQHPADPRKPNK